MIPKVSETRTEKFRSGTAPEVFIGGSLIDEGRHTYEPLVAALQTRLGSPRVSNVVALASSRANGSAEKPYIVIGLTTDDPLLEKLVHDLPPAAQMHIHREGYVLDISSKRIAVAAVSPAGVYYGVRALLDRMSIRSKGVEVDGGLVADWPTMARRGFHFLVKSRAELPDFESIITEFMPRFRLNEIILELNYHYEYQSHPEVREEECWTAADCRRLKQLADIHGIKIIPMLNCLGHQSWADETFQLLIAHPEFDETPDIPLDNKEIYCRSWCPQHPEVNPLIFDLIDEVIDVFQADAFHAGMDEVFILGRCPKCRTLTPAELFAMSVKDIHQHVVRERGLEMLIWGDRLIETKTSGYGEWEASANDTAPAIDLIPKDIVICDWHYETNYHGKRATYPSVREFSRKGFRVWPAGWKSAENARMLSAVALEAASDCVVGYLATTWTSVGAVSGGLRGDKKRLGENYIEGIVAAINEGSRIAWEGTIQASDETSDELTVAVAIDASTLPAGHDSNRESMPRVVDSNREMPGVGVRG